MDPEADEGSSSIQEVAGTGSGADAPPEQGGSTGAPAQSMDEAVAAALRGGNADAGVAPGQGEGAPTAEPAKGAKPADAPKDDPDFVPPSGLAPEAEARFVKLVDRVRSAEGKAVKYDEFKPRYDAMEADVTELRRLMTDHQCGPDELGALLEFNRLRKSGDIAGARAMVLDVLQEMGLETGEVIEPIDPLAKFPDLLEEVEDGYVTRQRAIEIARSRQREDGERRQSEARRRADQGQQAVEQAVTDATQAIADWAKKLRDEDIDFVAKEKALLASIDEVVGLYKDHPDLWLPSLQREYKLLRSGGAAPGAGRGPGGGQARPLRPQGAGSMRQQPKDEFEAVKLALTGGLVG